MFRFRPGPVIATLLLVSAPGCVTRIPVMPGDPRTAPVYGYTPLDPIPVNVTDAQSDSDPQREALLKALADETIRIAIGELSAAGRLEFGSAKIGVKGRSYEVVLDYIKFTTQSFPANIATDDAGIRRATVGDTMKTKVFDAFVPVYVGVGLRLTASLTVREGNVDLGNLLGIGAAAQAGRVTGTLVVQTLGISGENITTLIPVPGRIDDSTIQNAMVALGAIKSKLYEDGTEIVPRVVGVYNTLGGGEQTINGFISLLFEKPISLNVSSKRLTRAQ
ncbi:MAG: hypothetical protein ACRENP_15425 [Longimicrobiales bacterium]